MSGMMYSEWVIAVTETPSWVDSCILASVAVAPRISFLKLFLIVVKYRHACISQLTSVVLFITPPC